MSTIEVMRRIFTTVKLIIAIEYKR